MQITVTGAGGMIGGHLVRALLDQGHAVRAVDIKPKAHWDQVHEEAANWVELDCTREDISLIVCRGSQHVYNLAEDMGGIGYIQSHVVTCAESIKVGMTMLKSAAQAKVERFFFSSSACIYPTGIQSAAAASSISTAGLREEEAWPAQPEDGYGLSKLYIEEMCRYYREAGLLDTRVARFHNVFGPWGSWNDDRTKAPAALCRKIAEAKLSGADTIDVWGDGSQLRSYLHVADCVRGMLLVMNSDHVDPINIGSDFAVTVNELIETIAAVADYPVLRNHIEGALGVGARNADISKAAEVLGWKPQLTLEEGLADLYNWIEPRVKLLAPAVA